MKEYQKPEVKIIALVAEEEITTGDLSLEGLQGTSFNTFSD